MPFSSFCYILQAIFISKINILLFVFVLPCFINKIIPWRRYVPFRRGVMMMKVFIPESVTTAACIGTGWVSESSRYFITAKQQSATTTQRTQVTDLNNHYLPWIIIRHIVIECRGLVLTSLQQNSRLMKWTLLSLSESVPLKARKSRYSWNCLCIMIVLRSV